MEYALPTPRAPDFIVKSSGGCQTVVSTTDWCSAFGEHASMDTESEVGSREREFLLSLFLLD